MRKLMELLLSPAIDAPGKGWRMNGFALVIVSIVVIVGLLRAPAVFEGGALSGGVWKIAKLVQKKGTVHQVSFYNQPFPMWCPR